MSSDTQNPSAAAELRILQDPARSAAAMPIVPAQPDFPTHVGRYRLVRRVGRGGFADVYLAHDTESFGLYALKVLRADLDARFAEQVRVRFLAEEKIAKAIDHPAIVRIRETSAPGEEPCYIAMEYISGEPFCDYFTCLRRNLEAQAAAHAEQDFLIELARVGHQIAEALARAHAQGIVHRDLKPDNVLVATDDSGQRRASVRILDFGIAKAPVGLFSLRAAPQVTRYWTELGTVMGSPPYMAPEQNGAAHAVTGKADVFALGVMLLITALRLDHDAIERAETPIALPMDFDRLVARAPLPKLWFELLRQMTAEIAEERPAMSEVARRLQRLARREDVFGAAVEAWLKHGKVPSRRRLVLLMNWAETAADMTADEKLFLQHAARARLERLQTLTVLAGMAVLISVSAAVAGFMLRQRELFQSFSVLQHPKPHALEKLVATGTENRLATKATVADGEQQRDARIALERQLQSKDEKLANQTRLSEQRLAAIGGLNDKLAACKTAKERAESRENELFARAESAEKQLSSCQRESDEQSSSASSCQRELASKAQALAESTDRLRVCTKTLRHRDGANDVVTETDGS